MNIFVTLFTKMFFRSLKAQNQLRHTHISFFTSQRFISPPSLPLRQGLILLKICYAYFLGLSTGHHTFWLKFTPKGNLKCSSRYTSDSCPRMFLQCMRLFATKEEYLYLLSYKFGISRIKKWISCCYVDCIFFCNGDRELVSYKNIIYRLHRIL